MPLPKIDLPVFELKLPLTNKKVKCTLLSGKEEKLLLLAKESKDPREYLLATRQVISNCMLDKTIDVNELASFELEYIFLQLRSKSIGETVEVAFSGRENTNCTTCRKSRTVKINLADVSVIGLDKMKPKDIKVSVDKSLGIIMKYPTYEALTNVSNYESEAVGSFEFIAGCIDRIYDNETVYEAKDLNKNELVEFVESLPQKDIMRITEFFDSMPKLSYTVELNCKECGYEQKIVLEGLNDFFS